MTMVTGICSYRTHKLMWIALEYVCHDQWLFCVETHGFHPKLARESECISNCGDKRHYWTCCGPPSPGKTWALSTTTLQNRLPATAEGRKSPLLSFIGLCKEIHWQENWRERTLKTRPGEWVWNGRQKSLQSLLKQVLPSFQEMRYGVWNPL